MLISHDISSVNIQELLTSTFTSPGQARTHLPHEQLCIQHRSSKVSQFVGSTKADTSLHTQVLHSWSCHWNHDHYTSITCGRWHRMSCLQHVACCEPHVQCRWEGADSMARQQLLMDWRTSLNTLKNMMKIVVALAPATTADFKVTFTVLALPFGPWD